jgi:Na+/H+-dicarboxylate symporter/ABC-type amino acid transport substrate-binding protein
MRLSLNVFIGLLLGIFAGLFLGPYASVFQPIAFTFTMLLQMVVLPYLSCSLIHGLGSMMPQTAKQLFKSCWPFFLFLWVIVFFLIFLLWYLMPSPNGILQATTAAEKEGMVESLLQTVIPQNPFYDLANNFLPAVVVFSLIVGIALMHIEQKEPFCSFLERMEQAFEKIFHWLAAISPIGVFAHIAIGVGNAQLENLYKLEFYILSFVLVCLFITFWVLPLILSSMTELTYRDVLQAYRSVCVLPFLTGLPTLAIPFLFSYLRKHKNPDKTTEAILPMTYAFGEIGNCLLLYFIFFLSFYYRHPFTHTEEWALSFMTIPLSLGTAATTYSAVPYLVNQFHFPEQAIELYMQTAAITINFQTLTSVASILALILLINASFYGNLRIKWSHMIGRVGSSLALFTVIVLTLKPFLHFKDHYQDLYGKLQMAAVIEHPVPSELLEPGEGTARNADELPLRQILASGVLKVGYSPEAVPYSYFNDKNELVGYDIAYAYQLARDLDCRLEFIPANFTNLAGQLDAGDYDIGMSAFLMTEERLAKLDFSHPYDTQHNVLIVHALKKEQFMNLDHVVKNPHLVILAGGAFADIGQRHFPLAKILSSPSMQPLLSGEADVLLWNRSSAFVWCLSHPEYVTIDYGGALGKSYLTYLVRADSVPFQTFLNEWLLLKQQSGFQKEMQDYWIDGEVSFKYK